MVRMHPITLKRSWALASHMYCWAKLETTLLELAQHKQPVEQIRGLAFPGPFGSSRTLPREHNADLDSLPLPAWDLVDAERYRTAWHMHRTWIFFPEHGCKPRLSVQLQLVRQADLWPELSLAAARVQSPGGDAVSEGDASPRPHLVLPMTSSLSLLRWTQEFSQAVEELDARLPFRMQSRCDLMTRETVAALRDAGCTEVWMGAESGAQTVRDAMDNGIREEDIFRARETLRRHGIRACFFLQFGYPGEEWPEIEATIRMVREAQPDDIGISVSYPLPGTRFYDSVAVELGKRANWSDSADLAMMFQGPYSTDFYRALADALHLEVRGGAGVDSAWQRVQEMECAVVPAMT